MTIFFQKKIEEFNFYFDMVRILILNGATDGTRTRTNRAEVCYATPTTSYPHNLVFMMTVQFYMKMKYKIKRKWFIFLVLVVELF